MESEKGEEAKEQSKNGEVEEEMHQRKEEKLEDEEIKKRENEEVEVAVSVEAEEGEKHPIMEIDVNKALTVVEEPTPLENAPSADESSIKSPGLEYLVEAMLRDGSSSRSPQSSASAMNRQIKEDQEDRVNACREVIHQISAVDFSSLTDKEIRAFLMIREIGIGIVHGQRKLPTDCDVSRVLKESIERMVGACRKIVDQVSEMDFHDLNEQERESLTVIMKIARGIIAKQGAHFDED